MSADTDLPEVVDTDSVTAEELPVEEITAEEPTATAEPEPEALSVTFDGEDEAAKEVEKAPEWVRELRKNDREKTRRIRELEAQVARQQPAQAAVIVGSKPTLQACDYDEDKFAAELEAWHGRKAAADRQAEDARKAQETQAQAWQKVLDRYEGEKREMSIRIPSFREAEEVVKDAFDVTQQSILLKIAKKPALMVAALGNNDRKARELAAIKDPLEFAAAIREAEMQVKTQSRKPSTQPERQLPRSSVAGAAAVDDQLSKLHAEAAKTGDRTKVVQYLRGKRAA